MTNKLIRSGQGAVRVLERVRGVIAPVTDPLLDRLAARASMKRRRVKPACRLSSTKPTP